MHGALDWPSQCLPVDAEMALWEGSVNAPMKTHVLLIYKTLMSSHMYSLSDEIAFLFGEN